MDALGWVIVWLRFMECHDIFCLGVPKMESALSRRGNNLVFILPFGVKQDQTGLEMLCYYSAL